MHAVPWLEALKAGARSSGSARRVLVAFTVIAWLKALHWVKTLDNKRVLADAAATGDAAHVAAGKAPAPEEAMCVSKKSLPYLLAFVAGWYDTVCFRQYKCYANMMTGNTLNLFMKIGNRDMADVALIAAAVVHFISGFTLFRYLDMRMKGRGSCIAVAPAIVSLFALADVYRKKFPQSRWHMLFLAVAGGIINSVSAERAKIVTNMMTGHYQKLSGDLADYLAKGISSEQHASALLSIRVVATFCSGVSVGMAAWNIKHNCPVLERRCFAIIGFIYALILVLHELPLELFKRKKAIAQSAPSATSES